MIAEYRMSIDFFWRSLSSSYEIELICEDVRVVDGMTTPSWPLSSPKVPPTLLGAYVFIGFDFNSHGSGHKILWHNAN